MIFTSCGGVRGGYIGASEYYRYDSFNVSSMAKSTQAKTNTNAMAEFKNTTTRSGFFIGYYLTDIEIADKFELQPEIDYIHIEDLGQIQLPILAKYEVIENLNALAGPNIGYIIDPPNGIKSFNFGVDIGASYSFIENFNVNARYNLGLANLIDDSSGNQTSRLRGIQIGIGYEF
ncbi:hypothetical protein PK35_08060 [Tamlana nanhaiensis]|uniref:Outer membrane protein beta-barrel domain-containing protein n=2 Tax=Neotamlana nanhaiensis TaxID=1382798 RepID=A0A0D7W1G3_9FLAO|nr:hypothetical protein PK35_08060 [Tamlana nanhaiensis]